MPIYAPTILKFKLLEIIEARVRIDEHFNADILILAVTKIHSKPQDFLSDLRRLAL